MARTEKVNIWMPFYIGDFRNDTHDMSLECKAMYLNLLMAIWTHDGQISSDDEDLQLSSGANKAQWDKHKAKLARLFHQTAECWMHKGINDQLKKSKEIYEKKSKAGKAGNAARWHKPKEESF